MPWRYYLLDIGLFVMVYREATEGAAAMILRTAIMTIRYGAIFSVLSVNSV